MGTNGPILGQLEYYTPKATEERAELALVDHREAVGLVVVEVSQHLGNGRVEIGHRVAKQPDLGDAVHVAGVVDRRGVVLGLRAVVGLAKELPQALAKDLTHLDGDRIYDSSNFFFSRYGP